MGIRSLSTASISTGVKRSKVWDQSAVYSLTAYDSIATVTLSSPAASITFSSIPQTYVHLQVRGIMRANTTNQTSSSLYVTLNSDSNANYSSHRIYGNNTSVAYNSNANSTPLNSLGIGSGTGPNSLANTFAANLIDILDYTNTNKNTTLKGWHASEQNSTNDSYMLVNSLGWNNTAAVTTIRFDSNGTQFETGTTFALYGIKNS